MRLTKKLRRNADATLTPDQYRKLRERVGSRAEAADVLGVAADTIRKREGGVQGYPIDREATLALLAVSGVWTPE